MLTAFASREGLHPKSEAIGGSLEGENAMAALQPRCWNKYGAQYGVQHDTPSAPQHNLTIMGPCIFLWIPRTNDLSFVPVTGGYLTLRRPLIFFIFGKF